MYVSRKYTGKLLVPFWFFTFQRKKPKQPTSSACCGKRVSTVDLFKWHLLIFNKTQHRVDRTALGWEGTDRVLRYNFGSRDSTATWPAAPRGKLLQQTDDDFNSFQQSWVSVGSCSQKLRINLLVGLEDCIFFSVTARAKQTGEGDRGRGQKQQALYRAAALPCDCSVKHTQTTASVAGALGEGTVSDHENMVKEYMPSREESGSCGWWGHGEARWPFFYSPTHIPTSSCALVSDSQFNFFPFVQLMLFLNLLLPTELKSLFTGSTMSNKSFSS